IALEDVLVAFRYLTVLPLPRRRAPGDLGRAVGWFPVVGLVVGGGIALASIAADRLVPPGVGAILVVALLVGLTRALHLRGPADSSDGLGGGWSRERALSIMRDARSGPFGVTAIVLVLGLKAATVATLPEGLAWRALVLAPVLGRAGPLLLVALCPAARTEGAGHALAAGAGWPGLLAGGLVAVVVAVAMLGAWSVLLLTVSGLLAWGWAAYLRRRIGGFTGDTLGALVEVTEAITLTITVSLDFLELV